MLPLQANVLFTQLGSGLSFTTLNQAPSPIPLCEHYRNTSGASTPNLGSQKLLQTPGTEACLAQTYLLAFGLIARKEREEKGIT